MILGYFAEYKELFYGKVKGFAKLNTEIHVKSGS